MQNTADRKDSILKTDITEPITDHLLSFFQGEESLDSFIERYGAEKIWIYENIPVLYAM